MGKKVDLDSVPIYLMATAGMRVLPSTDRNACVRLSSTPPPRKPAISRTQALPPPRACRPRILTKVRAVLHDSPFSFSDGQARVIAGEEEGVYGWVTANYLTSRLEGPSADTVGALDLGGASAQITFAPRGELLANLFWLHLSTSLNRRLYTHSYLYYGVNQAEDRVAGALVRAASPPGAKVVDSPCYNEGYTRNYTAHGGSGPSFLLRGTGSFTACRLHARALMGCAPATRGQRFPCPPRSGPDSPRHSRAAPVCRTPATPSRPRSQATKPAP